MQRVRLPWAIVVPNGLSVLARSLSTWIHWWSPETSANLSMSSWVTSRQSLGPMVCPTSALSSSIPFTVVGVLMARSISAAVVPGLGVERLAQRSLPAAHHGLSVGHEHAVEVELEERLHRGVEALAIEALDLGVDPVRGPDDEPAIGLGEGVAEDEGVVAREVERHLIPAWLADGMRSHAGGQRHARVDLAEGGAVLEALGRCRVPVDRRLGVLLVAAPDLLRAAHVVRDRDQ